jgi:tight adherence protein C
MIANLMSMLANPVAICALASASAFLIIAGTLGANNGRGERNNDDWLWVRTAEKMYDAIFQDRDPVLISKKLGLEYDKYMIACNVVGRVPNIKKEAMGRAAAISCFFAGVIASIVLFNPVPLFASVVVYYFAVSSVTRGVQSAAKRKKRQITLELPRFADLLHSALSIDLPIEKSIEMISKQLPGALAKEMRHAIAEVQMGAKNWQAALEGLARKFEVDTFSDFVLDLVTAAEKGVPIVEAVARKSIEIKQQRLLDAKDKTAKMTSTILLPIAIFKILPLLLFMMLPALMQIINGF